MLRLVQIGDLEFGKNRNHTRSTAKGKIIMRLSVGHWGRRDHESSAPLVRFIKGTLSGNPYNGCGIASLKMLKELSHYERLEERDRRLQPVDQHGQSERSPLQYPRQGRCFSFSTKQGNKF